MCTACGITTPGKMLDKLNSRTNRITTAACHTHEACTGCGTKNSWFATLVAPSFTSYILKKMLFPTEIITLCSKMVPDQDDMVIEISQLQSIIKYLLEQSTTNDDENLIKVLTALNVIVNMYTSYNNICGKVE